MPVDVTLADPALANAFAPGTAVQIANAIYVRRKTADKWTCVSESAGVLFPSRYTDADVFARISDGRGFKVTLSITAEPVPA